MGRGIHLGEARTLVDGANLADGWPLGQPKGGNPWMTLQGPMAPPLGGGRCTREEAHGLRGGEINGYPFTTFTDFSDFLGIIPRVSSDDLAYYVDFHWSI